MPKGMDTCSACGASIPATNHGVHPSCKATRNTQEKRVSRDKPKQKVPQDWNGS